MIECSYPVLAVFQDGVEKAETTLLVLAWDDAGSPLVLGDKGLTAASGLPGFTGVRLPAPDSGTKPPPDRPDPVVIHPPKPDRRDQP